VTQRPSLLAREAGTSQPANRRRRRRVSASHVLIALAVVLAFVLNILALRDRDARVLVAVAYQPIASGSVLTREMIRLVPVDAGFAALGTMVTEDRLDESIGSVVVRSVPRDAVIDLASLAPADSGSGKRLMSVAVEESRAAGGMLVPGDRADVIAVLDGRPVFVVAGAEVVAVPERGSGALGRESFGVVLAVDADEALALARAMAEGRIDLVRSTGAPEVGAVADGTGS
jgi:Flp pilus assembly protein CpaB